MKEIFYEILNLSLSAAYLVPVVLVLRLVLKKAPRWTVCLLWGLVALRLVMPFSLESDVSLHPGREPVTDLQNQFAGETARPETPPAEVPSVPAVPEAPALPSVPAEELDLMEILAYVWLAGACTMALYGLVSYFRLKLKVRPSLQVEKRVFVCDGIGYPFLLGVLRPKVYLPSDLEEPHLSYVLAHEKAHVKRGDHLWKPLGFALLTIHWFNPLLWVAYLLLCRDIEAACDEKVVRDMDNIQKDGYSRALLACSLQGAFHRRWISACPVAFGETGVKTRIKSVLHYKKPAFWVLLIAILACVAVGVFFLTDPAEEPDVDSSAESSEESLEESLEESAEESIENTSSESSEERFEDPYLTWEPSWGEVDPAEYNYQFFDVSPEEWTVPIFSVEPAEEVPSFVVRTEKGGYEMILADGRKNMTIPAEYYWYLPYLSEDLYEQAMAELPEDGHPHFSRNKEGYLYLYWEAIRDLVPENPGDTGCNIDHEHVFGGSRLSAKALESYCGEGATGVIYRSGDASVRGSGYLMEWANNDIVFNWDFNRIEWSGAKDPRLAFVPTLLVTDEITVELPEGMTLKWVDHVIPSETGYASSGIKTWNTLKNGTYWIKIRLQYEKDGITADFEDIIRLDIRR